MSDNFGPETSLARQKRIHEEEEAGTYKPNPMSSAELEAIERSIKAWDALIDSENLTAKYKLEVQFGKDRTTIIKPYAGVISCWLSGNKFHGGGDEKIFECPVCGHWIFSEQITQQTVQKGEEAPEFCSTSACGYCGTINRSEETIGERFYKLTAQDWAYAILRMFEKLEMNADIYLKYHPEDIRYRTMMEMARDRGGEEVAKARKNRGLHIYPLRNIVIDTSHGADLYKRIKAFITA